MAANTEWTSQPFRLCPTVNAALPEGQKPDGANELATGMALVHNVMLRTLNAIHAQAPHVKPADVPAFLGFCLNWCNVLSLHHDGEEETCFPAIERIAGRPGLMDTNVQQHAVFHEGLTAFKAYLEGCQRGENDFDGVRARELVDVFGGALAEHLHDEIPTLLELRDLGEDKLKEIIKIFEAEAQENMGKAGMATGMMSVFVSHDVTFEDGRWASWPPVPWVMLAVIRNVVYWVHSDWWKFAPTDRYGQPKAQYAKPEEA